MTTEPETSSCPPSRDDEVFEPISVDGATRLESFTAPQEMRQALVYQRLEASFSSIPLPLPERLERLTALYTDAAKIVFDQMVAQAGHRRKLESAVVTSKNQLASRGQIIGGVLAGFGLIDSFVVTGLGFHWAGTTMATTCLGGIVGFLCSASSIRCQRVYL